MPLMIPMRVTDRKGTHWPWLETATGRNPHCWEGENIGQVRLVEERIDFASSSETLSSRFELCSISTNATYKSVI